MKKNVFRIITIFILIVIYIYVCNIETIPDNIVIFEGENIKLKTILGLNIEGTDQYKTALTSVSFGNSIDTNKVNVNLFGNINVKTVNVDIIPTTTVVPIGQAIGIKLYTKGVLVVGMSEIENEKKEKIKPYINSGIDEGDSIIAVNNNEVSNTNELIAEINRSEGEKVDITYLKNNKIEKTTITPEKSKNEYKLGLWVRDATAGVGTLTFYEPSTNMFMALGHGISDIDTGNIVNISNGELVTANILSIVKGQKDKPGEIRGSIINGKNIGRIYKNTNFGIYGLLTTKGEIKYLNYSELQVAPRNQIKEEEASILCEVDNEGVKEYKIQIEKIHLNNNENNKSMLIKVTDERLIEKTGGIIQGMSGAPIIQNGKFIGAITNVLVKDPTQGYAVFGDILIKQMREV